MAYGPSTGQMNVHTMQDTPCTVGEQTRVLRLVGQLERIAARLDEVCGNVNNECNRLIGPEPTKIAADGNVKMLGDATCDLDRLDRVVTLLDRKANDLHYAAARIQRI